MKYPVAKPVFHGNEREYLMEAFDSSWISSTGKFIDRLEVEFAEFCGTNYALTCSNGTTALHLALLALDVGPGDEVIVPTFTYVATANAVRYCGATPVFVDCRSDTWNINESLIERVITEKTKAIIVVHLYGHPCEMEPIWQIADKYGLNIIEDAAEAHGALYYGERHKGPDEKERYLKIGSAERDKNHSDDQHSMLDSMRCAKRVGSLGDIATFSLYGNKIITAGEGGLITLNNERLFEKVIMLRGQGVDAKRRYWFPIVGYNYRLTNLQAAIALGQLEDIDWHLKRRRQIADTYNNYLAASEFVDTPVEFDNVEHAYWMYSITLTDRCSLSRDEIITELAEFGIESRPFFYPVHQLPPYYQQDSEGKYPVADRISSRGLNLPSSNDLSEDSIAEICESLLLIMQRQPADLDLRECQRVK